MAYGSSSSLGPKGSTTRWRQLRKHWAARLPLPCGRCGETVQPTDLWDLDHLVPRAQGGTDDTCRPSHRACNRAAANQARAVAPKEGFLAEYPPPSRDW